jgi:aspartate-semialdehyde dehydrogenase
MSQKSINVAVLGVTGAVGETLLSILEERDFPVATLFPLASHRSAGKTVQFQGEEKEIIDVEKFDFKKAGIALFSAGGSVSEKYAPIAASAGCVVIDNTSFFRTDDAIPLVIPEVNPEKIADYKNKMIIANPNCSTIQMLVALKPIYDKVGIHRINVATYQAVSGSGRQAISELVKQTGDMLNGRPGEAKVYPYEIAFNVIPHIDTFMDNGYTREEMKMVWETQKIFNDDAIKVNPTTVRVPVLYGHSEAVNIELKAPMSASDAQKLLRKAPGVTVIDNVGENYYPTPLKNGAGTDEVYVGRIRNDISCEKGLNLWVVSDNVRKGAALNAIQIAEILLEKYL